MNSPENVIKKCLIHYPNLFGNRADVMEHLFLTIGNGYEWVNGELVDLEDPENKQLLSIESGLESIISGLKDFTGDLWFKNPAEHEISKLIKKLDKIPKEEIDCEIDETSDLIKNRSIKRVEQIFEDVLSVVRFEDIYKEPLQLVKTRELYPLFDCSKIMTIPSDVTPEWRACAKEFLDYLMSSEEEKVVIYRKIHYGDLIKIEL